jgi:hypothetical protein
MILIKEGVLLLMKKESNLFEMLQKVNILVNLKTQKINYGL